ncbi:hypothetical protein [Niallia taxi]|uniref:hypothetical protein n=1 Tax=Niallia taxi TaxID=2499688 RepID=UPI002E1C8C74|nr:hypothetical protein [Niallia taxi]
MENKTIQIIDKVCKLDTDVEAMVLLTFCEAVMKLYYNIDDDVELESCLEKYLKRERLKDSILLQYCGFSSDDDTVGEIFDEYYTSNSPDRMHTLKKQLIECAIEFEQYEKD